MVYLSMGTVGSGCQRREARTKQERHPIDFPLASALAFLFDFAAHYVGRPIITYFVSLACALLFSSASRFVCVHASDYVEWSARDRFTQLGAGYRGTLSLILGGVKVAAISPVDSCLFTFILFLLQRITLNGKFR